ncbi:MAG: undecaprenyl/decaprenyl-phosphate alpha-N-acetylglucosaminyl 1-phosphate transferase [Phototrophicales bacterium]|nr:MAG: undecaprenyl/decaprenyl-phosphate alpha-N-acetylglucosaminyl 1-phosphate transferase [Phototrophicales bacterium]RMG75394.1 MAG: undecaprenyl/decaprenyl-phosphate alpha-N-acetylglucosaminyl 1-phosphate transferase [Chloroflexota bacterium]
MTILVLFIALFFAMGVTPLVRELAYRINFVAVPKSDRLHTQTTPLMGGVALYIGFTIAILLLMIGIEAFGVVKEVDRSLQFEDALAILGGGTAFAMIGLWDDWHDLNSKLKLGVQLITVVVFILATDIRIDMPIPQILNLFFTICWFLYVMNAFNYMDNMDGVAGMTATVAGMFFTVIALINGQNLLAGLSAAVAGGAFGFLRYNLFHERKIFMGDVGSLFLGFLLAAIGLVLRFKAESPWVTWPVPVLVLGVPIFDTALVFISRMRRGQSFLQGGTDHLSHRMSRMQLGRYGVPFGVGLLGSALGCVAIIIMHSSLQDSLAAQLFVGGCAVFVLWKLEYSQSYEFITGKQPPQS